MFWGCKQKFLSVWHLYVALNFLLCSKNFILRNYLLCTLRFELKNLINVNIWLMKETSFSKCESTYNNRCYTVFLNTHIKSVCVSLCVFVWMLCISLFCFFHLSKFALRLRRVPCSWFLFNFLFSIYFCFGEDFRKEAWQKINQQFLIYFGNIQH